MKNTEPPHLLDGFVEEELHQKNSFISEKKLSYWKKNVGYNESILFIIIIICSIIIMIIIVNVVIIIIVIMIIIVVTISS